MAFSDILLIIVVQSCGADMFIQCSFDVPGAASVFWVSGVRWIFASLKMICRPEGTEIPLKIHRVVFGLRFPMFAREGGTRFSLYQNAVLGEPILKVIIPESISFFHLFQ